jgi:uncharacterized protein (TIGR02145 family)
MIPGSQSQLNNLILEKYCYTDNPDSCTKYGGLYQWNEMMQYTTLQGVQGICPLGWHLPTDKEWKVLEGAADSQYGIGNDIWDSFGGGYRGNDAGTNLKDTSGWIVNGNSTDLFGFSGLPGGDRYHGWGGFADVGYLGVWWTSTEYDLNTHAWYHELSYGDPGVRRDYSGGFKDLGFSVRCLRDY